MKFNPLKIQKEVNAHCSFDELQIEKTDSREEVLEKLRNHQKWLIDNADQDVARISAIIQIYHLDDEDGDV